MHIIGIIAEYNPIHLGHIYQINKIKEKQKVVSISYNSQDVIASCIFDGVACVEVFLFRGFKLWDKQHYFIEDVTDKTDFYAEFLQRYYGNKTDIPPRILMDCEFDGKELIENWVSCQAGTDRRSV